MLLPRFVSELPADQIALPDCSHSPALVLLAYLIASAAGYTALALAGRVQGSSRRGRRELWCLIGALALGGGIWSMHFIAMLAFQAPVAIRYDHRITLLSLAIAVSVSYVVMRLLARDRLCAWQYAVGASAAGLGIAAMHYTGMAAIRSAAQAYYDPVGFVLSILIAIGASLAALLLAFHFRGKAMRGLHWQRVLSSLAMGAAIVSMHFVGMQAMTLSVPADSLASAGAHLLHAQNGPLALMVGFVALAIIVTGIAASWAEQRFSEQRAQLEQAQNRLASVMQYDPLTDLLNGHAFSNAAGGILSGSEGRCLALLTLDLDHFKRINDSLGHRAGDEILRQVGQRIRAMLGSQDILARFAADEFCMLVQAEDAHRAERLAARIITQLQPPFSVGTVQLRLTASIGLSVTPEDGARFDDLFRKASLALGQCKASGRNRALRFTAELETQAHLDLRLEHDLRQSIKDGQLRVHYQPIVDCDSGRVIGLEALARWTHPIHGPISPERFVDLAERNGFIDELDLWVTRRACRDLRSLRQGGHPALRVAVNCSALNLINPDFPAALAEALADTGLEPERLTVEITENALMNDLNAAIEVLETIRQLGVKVSIDDFGTGYSSLAYLRRLPVDTLKVDRSFVREITEQASDRAITAAIVAMAHKLQLRVVAEGVETAAQRDFLSLNGCDMIQGYLYSQPLALADLEAWLVEREDVSAATV